MDFLEELHDNIMILRVDGRLDAISSPQLEKKVNSLIDAGNTKLLLDFANVEYLSSAGMRLLLSATKKLKNLGGRLVVCSVEDSIMDVIRMAGFNSILTITSTEEKAFSEFK